VVMVLPEALLYMLANKNVEVEASPRVIW